MRAAICLDPGAATDEDVFLELIAAARRHRRSGDSPTAGEHYRRALALWRGSDAWAGTRTDLVEVDRARLNELRADIAEELAATLLDHSAPGGPDEALALMTDLITTHPLRERAHQLAMLAAYRCGRQADALEIYQALRRRLRAELGIEPTPAAAQLYSSVLRQDPTLDTGDHPTSMPGSIGATGLPAPVSPLIGRVVELTGLQDALSAGQRLITIVGPGGVGKTRVLLELGMRHAGPKELVYTMMSGRFGLTADDLAEAIGVTDGARREGGGPLGALVDALSQRNLLLLIDEAEWVVESLAILAGAILASCPGVQIVTTSRIPLDVAGETLVAIEPLACPAKNAGIEAIRESAAVQFLMQRLSDRAVPVGIDGDTAALLASIADRVDGLPLALELAAGQATGRSLADVAMLIQSPLDVAAIQPPRNVRHRSLRDTLEWSMSRLEPSHRAVLRRLSVFVGPFELAAAKAVAGGGDSDVDVSQTVRSLARDALIHLERSSASRLTFRLLRTVRDLAAEGFEADELATTQALHRRWHAGRWRGTSVDLVVDVRERIDDYLEALRTALESRDTTTLADLTLTMAQFWQVVGGQAVGLRWIGRVLDSDVLTAGERARVQAERAALALHHDSVLVLADTAAAIPVLEATGDTSPTVTAMSVRAWELYAQGREDDAADLADRAVAVARAGSTDQLAGALAVAALIHAVTDRVEAATGEIAETRGHLDAVAAPADRITTGSTLALALVNLERFDAARDLLDALAPAPLATDLSPPRYLLTRGWALLGSGSELAALSSFSGSVPAEVPHAIDRENVESLLGAGCALAALGHPTAMTMLAGALELVGRVDFPTPPALGRAVDRARRQVEQQNRPDVTGEATAVLLARLEGLLAEAMVQLRSAESRSASG